MPEVTKLPLLIPVAAPSTSYKTPPIPIEGYNIDQLSAPSSKSYRPTISLPMPPRGAPPPSTIYQDLVYMGLQTSTFYQEEIIAKDLQPTVQANWGKLNEGGKCQD